MKLIVYSHIVLATLNNLFSISNNSSLDFDDHFKFNFYLLVSFNESWML